MKEEAPKRNGTAYAGFIMNNETNQLLFLLDMVSLHDPW
jgi:hypothetical protein